MKEQFLTASMIAGVSLLAANSAIAFERDHDAHEHGHATLIVAIEKNELQLALTSPAMNIVDFEHEARNKSERKKIAKAAGQLEAASNLFSINKEANCALEKAHVRSELMEDVHHKEHDHHDDNHHGKHHDDDHKEDHHAHAKHDHKKNHDRHHGHGEHKDHRDEESHSEFEAEYHYECADIAKLTSLQVHLFELFPGLKALEAQVLSPKGQHLVELEKGQTRVEF